MPTNFDYFLTFLRKKIMDGEKQIDIAKSNLVNKSAAYINKLYRGNPKTCPIKVQRNIAAYFKLSYEDMIEDGRLIYESLTPPASYNNFILKSDSSNGFSDPDELISHLSHVASAIKLNSEALKNAEEMARNSKKLLDEIELYKSIFEKLDEGVTFFDSNREFIYSSNRWGFLDGVDLTTNPSIDTIVFTIRKKIINFDEVLDKIFEVSENRIESEIDVNYHTGQVFHFKIVPIFKEENFLGTLLINNLKPSPSKKKK